MTISKFAQLLPGVESEKVLIRLTSGRLSSIVAGLFLDIGTPILVPIIC